MARHVRYPPGRGLKPCMCFRESVLSLTFNIWFSFSEQKKKVAQVDGSSCEVPPWKGTQAEYVLVEPVLCATLNIWFSFSEQKKKVAQVDGS